MQTIAYYISDYGYGHASRSIAIIRELLEWNPYKRIIVCTSFPLDFLKRSLAFYSNVQYRVVVNDIGYVLAENSLEPDIARFNWEYDQYATAAPKQINKEIKFLLDEQVSLVLSDIAPIPFLCADRLGIPSIGISNFTWYTAYKGLISEAKLQFLKNAYSKMDYFIALAGANEPLWGRRRNQSFDFVHRKVEVHELERIKSLIHPDPSKMLVYVGFGMKVNIDVLSSWKLWDNVKTSFIVSNSHRLNHPNVSVIPADYVESQHYIAAADLVITKSGWSTVSEAISFGKPLLILNRRNMEEDTNTIRYLQEKSLCKLIEWDDLSDLTIEPSIFQEMHGNMQHQAPNLDQINKIVYSIIEIIEINNGRRKKTV